MAGNRIGNSIGGNIVMKKIHLFIVTFFIIILMLPGCAKEKAKPEMDKVSVRLKWLMIATHSTGELVAKEKGFFKENNIDVTIDPGGIDLNSIKLVASGSNDIGITGGDQLILARAEGVPIKAIAVMHQESPVVFFSLKESGINEPKDFLGKKIGMKFGTNVETEYRAMMGKLRLDMKKVNEVPAKFDLTPILTKQVDIWSGYEVNEPLTVEEKGFEVNLIRPRDYGVHFYSNTYFTTEKMIKEKPDLIKRFLAAVVKGWEWALEHPENAIDILLKYNRQANREHELKALLKTKDLMVTDVTKKKGIGWMEMSRWKEMQTTLMKQNILKRKLRVEEFYAPKFLE